MSKDFGVFESLAELINARKTALSKAFSKNTKLFYMRFRARDSVTGVTAKNEGDVRGYPIYFVILRQH